MTCKIGFFCFEKLAARVKLATKEALYGNFQASTGTETAFVYSLDYYPEAFFPLSRNSISFSRKRLVKIGFFCFEKLATRV